MRPFAAIVGRKVLAAATAAALAATAGGLTSSLASAQNALDANLSTQGRANQAVPQQDFRSRNLVMTGDVGDGRGFRGSVGYRAADDFQGALGSETLRSFRAYSASSDPLLIQAISSPTRFDTAQGQGLLEVRRTFGSGAAGTHRGPAQPLPAEDSVALSLMRSNLATRAARDGSTGIYQLDGRARIARELGPTTLVTNPVAGLQAVDPREAQLMASLAPFDLVRLRYLERTLSTRDVTQPFRSPLRERAADTPTTTSREELRKMGPDSYWRAADLIESRLKESGTVDVPGTMEQMRLQLGDAALWGDRLREAQLAQVAVPADGAAAEGGDGEPRKWDPLEAAKLLTHEETVSSLVPTSAGRAADVIAAAQVALEDGRYRAAAGLFESATLLSPGNPLAKMGRAVSLAAAGLGVSAGIELRQLFAAYPEMIAMRLAGELGPTEQRWRDIGSVSLELAAKAPPGQQADLGLTAAFCGWQLQDTTLMRAGLTFLTEDPASSAFGAILQAIWLPGEAAQGEEPSHAPPAP